MLRRGRVTMERVSCMMIGYVFGSFLTAEVIARTVAKTSIFMLGDGNPGMANVGRELGKKAAIICLLGDILKTVAAVIISHAIYPQLEGYATAWAGLGSTLGHIFPFWHRFRGGKGVATIASSIILMAPLWGLLAGIVGVLAIIFSGYLSVAAVVAMAFYVGAMLFLGDAEFVCIALVFQLITVFCHYSKLCGIRDGTTHRAGLSIRFWNMFRRK